MPNSQGELVAAFVKARIVAGGTALLTCLVNLGHNEAVPALRRIDRDLYGPFSEYNGANLKSRHKRNKMTGEHTTSASVDFFRFRQGCIRPRKCSDVLRSKAVSQTRVISAHKLT